MTYKHIYLTIALSLAAQLCFVFSQNDNLSHKVNHGSPTFYTSKEKCRTLVSIPSSTTGETYKLFFSNNSEPVFEDALTSSQVLKPLEFECSKQESFSIVVSVYDKQGVTRVYSEEINIQAREQAKWIQNIVFTVVGAMLAAISSLIVNWFANGEKRRQRKRLKAEQAYILVNTIEEIMSNFDSPLTDRRRLVELPEWIEKPQECHLPLNDVRNIKNLYSQWCSNQTEGIKSKFSSLKDSLSKIVSKN